MIINNPQSDSSYPLADINIHAVPDNTLGNTDYNQRILPRQLSSGALRGTQNVGYGDVKIDGSNNQIIIGNVTDTLGGKTQTILGFLGSAATGDESFGLKVTDAKGGQLLIGVLPDGNLGIELIDASGNEVMRAGFLPVSGLYGWAAATPNNSLSGQV